MQNQGNRAAGSATYIALLDRPGQVSAVVGAFSDEDKARAASQEHHDEDAEVSGGPRTVLTWQDDTATLSDGDAYVVVLVGLDERVG